MLQHENIFVSPLTDFKRVTFCLSKVNGKQWLCDSGLLLHTLLLGNERQPRYSEMHFCSTVFEVKFFSVGSYRQGESESCSWVAAFCFAFVSKQMHSCHSRSHWRLLSNVIASKPIPMDARLQIQLFQVSVKRILQRGMLQKLQIYEFKYRRGTDIMIHIRHS